jgi:membrane protein YqaA with SNARE-associated domain
MLRKTYDWMMAQAHSRHAPRALFWVSFIESSVFPIPPDVMLVPMVLAQRLKAWWYATIATIGSVIGGVVGYAIGFFLFEAVAKPIMDFYGYTAKFGQVAEWFNEYGVWILIIKGMTPFPYKVLTILAGATHMPLLPFIIASIIARSMRFYLVAGLLYFFGPPIRDFIEKRLTLVTTVFVILLVGGFVAIKYI